MTIEIHRPELQQLIEQRMNSGAFRSVEDVLLYALTATSSWQTDGKMTGASRGASLVAAMQACPVKDVDLEPERFPMPVRDVTF